MNVIWGQRSGDDRGSFIKCQSELWPEVTLLAVISRHSRWYSACDSEGLWDTVSERWWRQVWRDVCVYRRGSAAATSGRAAVCVCVCVSVHSGDVHGEAKHDLGTRAIHTPVVYRTVSLKLSLNYFTLMLTLTQHVMTRVLCSLALRHWAAETHR